jgi:putative transposase
METLFDISGLSRQAFHEQLSITRQNLGTDSKELLLEQVRRIRSDLLPGEGARKLRSYMLGNEQYAAMVKGWGKHRFEKLCMTNGLRLVARRNFLTTTRPGKVRFDNLVEGLTINDINQVWVSDISYVFYGKIFIGYTTTIEDIYSRFLLALVVSRTMRTVDTVIPAVNTALKYRALRSYSNLILHSDRGSQYGASKLLEILDKRNIRSSMATNALENAYAERINSTIKNSYLYRWNVNSFPQLEVFAKKMQDSYNFHRPHDHLNGMNPFAFEQMVATLQPEQKPTLTVKIIE